MAIMRKKTGLVQRLKGICKVPKMVIYQIQADYFRSQYKKMIGLGDLVRAYHGFVAWYKNVMRVREVADSMSRDFGFKDMEDFYDHLIRKP